MFLKFKKPCVFHGDRVAGEMLSFDVPPPDASIVVGAGFAEWIEYAEETTETAKCADLDVETDIETPEPETPVKTARKKKRK